MKLSMMAPVFSRAGSPKFDRWMADRLEDLAGDVQSTLAGNLVALVLGGGYGRGEGAVVHGSGGERPYNDLDLIVIVNRRPGVARLLAPVSRRHEHALGIAVDFSRALTVGDVEQWEHRLRWHELYHGHRVLSGEPGIVVDHAPREIASPVPLREASRLLVNRGAGLVWARRVVSGLAPAPDRDFVRRNAYKALLAVGDAYLIAAGVLAPRHAGRQELLHSLTSQLPANAAARVLECYAAALAFKFEPDTMPTERVEEDLMRQANELWAGAFLHVESQRHGRSFDALTDYARWSGPREPAPATRWLRNFASNLRFGQLSIRAPQDPLYSQVASLITADPATPDWPARSAAFLRRWEKVND